MRRHEREITDSAQIRAFLAKEQIIRIAFCDDGEIYIVPVNYGFSCENGQYCFYFHGAAAGRKYELSLKHPAVGFEIDGNYELIAADTGCGHSAKFMSVIGTGHVTVIEDDAEKNAALNCLMRQITGKPEWEFDAAVMQKTALFRLDAEKISCKAK